jgi:hypothetical protein
MVDADIVASLLAAGDTYLADVRRFRDEAGRERFLADRGEQYKVEFPLQQVIQEDYEKFLSDPEIPAIARELALREPPVKADPVAEYDS